LQEMGKQVEALAKIGQAVQRVVDASGKQATPPLLDLLLVTRQVRANLARAGNDGAALALDPAGPWTTAIPVKDAGTLADGLDGSQSERRDTIRLAVERRTITDLRLVQAVIASLDQDSEPTAQQIVTQVIPAFGAPLIPELKRGLDLKGARADARRLAALCRLAPRGRRGMWPGAAAVRGRGGSGEAARC